MIALAGSLETGLVTNLMFDQSALMHSPGIVNNLNSTEIRSGNFDHVNLSNDYTSPYADRKPLRWTSDSILNASFDNGGVGAGNVDFFSAQISTILVQRQRVYKDDASDWLTVYEYHITEDITETGVLTFNIQDRLTAHGETYRYRFLPVLQQGEVQLQIIGGVSEPITATFNGVFICDAYKSYRLYAEVSFNDTTRVQDTGIHTPLGSKYPIVVMNSETDYATGGVNGVVLPENYGTIQPKIEEINNIQCISDCWTVGAIDRNYTKVVDERIILDRHEIVNSCNELLAFLTEKSPKILKDWNGNIWEVMFTGNPVISYSNQWGMGLPSVNATWTEIGDVNDEDSLRYGGLLGD